MNITEIEDIIKGIISKITGMEKDEIKNDVHLYRELGIDSIKAIELIVGIQERFHIRIDDSKIEKITSVKSSAVEVQRLLEK
jgi:acyl carrier protein